MLEKVRNYAADSSNTRQNTAGPAPCVCDGSLAQSAVQRRILTRASLERNTQAAI